MKNILPRYLQLAIFANELDPHYADIWAKEALMILHEETEALSTIHTAFSNEIADQGETVTTRRPAIFESERKVDGDALTTQDAKAAKVSIKLDFHETVSFLLSDRDMSIAFDELVSTYLKPAVQAISQAVDETITNMKWRFMSNMIGQVGTAQSKTTLIAINKFFHDAKAPKADRYNMMGGNAEADLLAAELFTNASAVGDDGTALREASIGRKFGVNNFSSQNVLDIEDLSADTGAINLVAGYAKGTTTFVIDGVSGAPDAGSWVLIAGDMRPRKVVSATTIQLVIATGIDFPVVNDAVITVYPVGAINLVAGYELGYPKNIVVDGFTDVPQSGQLVSIAANNYGIIGTKSTVTSLKLNDALKAAAANNDVVAFGPKGEYGFAYHKNAIGMITRPLDKTVDLGVKSAVVDHKGLGLRVTISYDGEYQQRRVTVDVLWGLEVLYAELGALTIR